MLAVLAMAFPGLAQAEESNSGIQYESEVPTVPTHESIPPAKHHKGSNTQSEGENEAPGSGTPNGGGTGGNGSNTGGGAHNGQSKGGSPGSNGSSGNGSKSAGGELGESKPVANNRPAEESGSSSPLVPILIAIAVLAAISIGAFYFRQRRQGRGDSPVSPKAS